MSIEVKNKRAWYLNKLNLITEEFTVIIKHKKHSLMFKEEATELVRIINQAKFINDMSHKDQEKIVVFYRNKLDALKHRIDKELSNNL